MNLRQAYGFSLICLLLGLLLSLTFNDWHWFGRSGSLVVVAGILLTSTEIVAHLHNLRLRKRFGDGWSQHDWAPEAETHSRLRGNHEDSGQLNSHGFYLLIAGTLIWGYGDLLGLLFQT